MKDPIIKLTEDEMRQGLEIVGAATQAQARLQVLHEMEAGLINRLAAKYGIDRQQYQIRDWLTGFEPITIPGEHHQSVTFVPASGAGTKGENGR
jgi:hypothetical protein